MTKLPALLLLTAALFLVACGSDDSSSSKPAAKATTAADACTQGQPQDEDARHAHRRAPTSRPTRRTSRTTTRPTARASRAPSRTRSPTKLGFAKDEVKWTVVPFNSSYAPGPKKFDFDVNQISITPKRAEARRLLRAVLHGAAGAGRRPRAPTLASATVLADVQDAKIGVQVGTTSLDAVKEVIKPDTRAEGLQQLHRRRDARSSRARSTAIVVDLPTAFYLTAAQVGGLEDRRPVRGARRRQLGRRCSRRARR